MNDENDCDNVDDFFPFVKYLLPYANMHSRFIITLLLNDENGT